jgi:hypothetical protein
MRGSVADLRFIRLFLSSGKRQSEIGAVREINIDCGSNNH